MQHIHTISRGGGPRPRDTWERIDAPQFGPEVDQAEGFAGANVEDEEDRSYPVKTVLAVPGTSQDVWSRRRETSKTSRDVGGVCEESYKIIYIYIYINVEMYR